MNYGNSKSKVEIICSQHGSFFQIPNSHLFGKGCPKCAIESRVEQRIFSRNIFIERASLKHGDKYDYSLVDYNGSSSKVIIICIKHGSFSQQAKSHLSGRGCPKCKSSQGEKDIRDILVSKNLKFFEQYRFKDCRNRRPLPFDFAIFKNEVLTYLIEFDGRLHFDSVDYFGGVDALNKTKERDEIKTKYCLDNNIKLIRIKYDEDIKSVLDKIC